MNAKDLLNEVGAANIVRSWTNGWSITPLKEPNYFVQLDKQDLDIELDVSDKYKEVGETVLHNLYLIIDKLTFVKNYKEYINYLGSDFDICSSKEGVCFQVDKKYFYAKVKDVRVNKARTNGVVDGCKVKLDLHLDMDVEMGVVYDIVDNNPNKLYIRDRSTSIKTGVVEATIKIPVGDVGNLIEFLPVNTGNYFVDIPITYLVPKARDKLILDFYKKIMKRFKKVLSGLLFSRYGMAEIKDDHEIANEALELGLEPIAQKLSNTIADVYVNMDTCADKDRVVIYTIRKMVQAGLNIDGDHLVLDSLYDPDIEYPKGHQFRVNTGSMYKVIDQWINISLNKQAKECNEWLYTMGVKLSYPHPDDIECDVTRYELPERMSPSIIIRAKFKYFSDDKTKSMEIDYNLRINAKGAWLDYEARRYKARREYVSNVGRAEDYFAKFDATGELVGFDYNAINSNELFTDAVKDGIRYFAVDSKD